GFNIVERLDEPIYVPRESFEMKLTPGHSGCEDPRIVRIDDRLYMFYTAYDNVNPPKVALTWIRVEDFLNREWKWSKPQIISPPGIDDKDACIIPEKINDSYFFIHRAGGVNIVYDYIESLEHVDNRDLLSFTLLTPREGTWDAKKVGLASPPIKTPSGWLVFYHGISHDNVYRVGAFLLDLKDPERILGRTIHPLLEPIEDYEKEGYVRNVVFPCGTVVRNDFVYLYYGGADSYVCVARAPLKEILSRI
ncbi:MAG: glycosidase, partial [Crenarchaeota archaeon]|nr:glycosidase [Thermoproteota archaeon]